MSLSSVKLGEGVKSISKLAFRNCSSLTSIKIPDSVTEIGLHAFDSCSSLKSVSFGSSYNMTDNPFAYCRSLTEITVSENNPYICAVDNVIYSKDKTKLQCYPQGRKGSFENPNFVTTIGRQAFSFCYNLTSVKISDSVTSIENLAFYYCKSLSQIIIGRNVDKIGLFGTFYTPSIKAIYSMSKFPPLIIVYQREDGRPDTFCDETYKYAKLYVPEGRGAKYEEADGWKKFRKIDEMDAGVEEAVGEDMAVLVVNGSIVIDGVEDGCTIEVYDITGKIVYNGASADIPNMPRGVYVVRIGNKTVKVAV